MAATEALAFSISALALLPASCMLEALAKTSRALTMSSLTSGLKGGVL